jgi:hypothetical protein
MEGTEADSLTPPFGGHLPRSIPRRGRAALLSLLFAQFPAPALAQSGPPETPKREVADTYFGTIIADPYR